MDDNSGFDWPYILYVGRVYLRYTEKEIWKLTPRKLQSQLRVHQEMFSKNGPATTPTGFIDQISGW